MTQTTHENTSAYGDTVAGALSEHRVALTETLVRVEECAETLARMAEVVTDTLRSGHKILVAGNGGSAAEAQHFSAELIGRFLRNRPPYPAIALTTDSSVLTALANDYSFEDVFSRQVDGLGGEGDLFIGFSTSGESENVVRAQIAARERGMRVIALTGSRPNRMEENADLTLRVPSTQTPIVQEVHTMVTHLLCGLAEKDLSPE